MLELASRTEKRFALVINACNVHIDGHVAGAIYACKCTVRLQRWIESTLQHYHHRFWSTASGISMRVCCSLKNVLVWLAIAEVISIF